MSTLVLNRRIGETLVIGNNQVRIKVLAVKDASGRYGVQFGVEAKRDVNVSRDKEKKKRGSN